MDVGCGFEELFCEHVDVALTNIMGYFVFGGFMQLLRFTLRRNRLEEEIEIHYSQIKEIVAFQ